MPHVAVEGPGHLVRYVNPALCLLVGKTADQLLGRPFAQIVPEGDAGGCIALFARVYRTGTTQNLLEQKHGNGGPHYWSYTAWPILGDDQRPVGIMVQVTDVTAAVLFQLQMKEMNQALVLGSVRQHELAETARDLNACLNVSNDALEHRVADRTAALRQRTGQLQRLNIELAHTEQRERKHLAEILHDGMQQVLVAAKLRLQALRRNVGPDAQPAVDELSELMTQSIAASRTLAVELFPPALHYGGLITGLNWLAKDMHDKHNLTVEVRAAEEVEPAGEGIKALLFQSARELLFNVVKHAGVDRALVTLERAADGALVLQVSDAGKGFDLLPVHAPEAAADTATAAAFDAARRRDPGAGFGIPSVRHRVDCHGGTMTTQSAPGEGTRVTITIPQLRS